MTQGYSGQTPPGFCGTVENEQWFGFIAYDTIATFTIEADSCINGNGLQLAIYTSCSGNPIICYPGQQGGAVVPINVTVPLAPGVNYFLMIDGYAGDQCSFSLTVNPASAVSAPTVGPTGPLSGPAGVCPGGSFTFSIPPVSGAGYYQWNAPPGWLIDGQAPPVYRIAPTGHSVQVTPDGTAGDICVQPLNSFYQGSEVCQSVGIVPPINTTTLQMNGFSGSCLLTGGLPQMNGSNYAGVVMALQGNPTVTATLTQAPFTHGDTVYFTAPQPGVYQLIATDANGCSSAATVVVSNNTGGTAGQSAGGCWQWQNPLPQGNALYTVYFADEQTGWTVGNKGTILKTADGGQTWATQVSGTGSNLIGVVFASDKQTGWAAGYDGVILKTTDGGQTWVRQTSGTTLRLNYIWFVDLQTGWALGENGTILKTSDGGASWIPQTSGVTEYLNCVYFLDNQNGWAVGAGFTTLRTTDGGQTWSKHTSGVQPLYHVYFTDSQTGWASGGNGIIIHTTDGGQTWSPQPKMTNNPLYCIHFTDSQTGWASGVGGTILRTLNGGQTWTVQTSGTVNFLSGIYSTNGQTAWSVGDNGVILKTTDGGTNWFSQGSGLSNTIESVFFADSQTGWAAGAGGLVLKTQNGGQNWFTQNSGTVASLRAVYFIDPQTGWAAGEGGTIVKTANGGFSWAPQNTPSTQALSELFFTGPQTGWAAGANGTILKTLDGGLNWNLQSSGASAELAAVFFADAQTGWVAGAGGVILKSTDGGLSWLPQTSGTTAFLHDLFFTDSQTGWAAGANGVILKTTDGGQTWTVQPSGTTAQLSALHFTDSQTGRVAGASGLVLFTTDGGQNWTIRDAGTTNNLRDIWFSDAQTGWVAGQNGTILHYSAAPPACVSAIPLHQQINVDPATAIIWSPVGGCTDGYRLSLGITPGGSDIVNHQDIGLNTLYQPAQPLPAGDTIFVRATAYNGVGEAGGCQEYWFVTQYSVCPPPNFPAPAIDCADAPVLCQSLDGYCNNLGNHAIPLSPFPGCPSFTISNPSWFAFFAGSTEITLRITPSNCGNNAQAGMQGGIYASCIAQPMDLQCTGTKSPFLLSANNFVVGQRYYLLLDGWQYDSCDYSIEVLSGSTIATPLCVSGLNLPGHQAVNTPSSTAIQWPAVSGCLSGYRLSLGLTPGGAELLNNLTVTDTFYQPAQPLPAGDTVYARIVPFSQTGDATGCEEYWFVTESTNPADTIPPCLNWQNALGGTLNDVAEAVLPTPDGGYIMAGGAVSNNGDVSGNKGMEDVWVVKLDANGGLEWQKTFGGSQSERAHDIQMTQDGGYILAGYTDSDDQDVSGYQGGRDVWVLKLSATGALQWQKTYGGSSYDAASSIHSIADGGYIVAGASSSLDGDVTNGHGGYDGWVFKIDGTGQLIWQRALGGSNQDYINAPQPTPDGAYILTGYTLSNDDDVTGNHGDGDIWLVKLSANGSLLWQKCLGGSSFDDAQSLVIADDGGYVVAGASSSADGDVSGNNGFIDAWIVKLDTAGAIQWQHSIGGTQEDRATHISVDTTGGYIIAGHTRSNNGDVSGNQGGQDAWVFKIGEDGQLLWQKCLGGTNSDNARSVKPSDDGGYVVAGITASTNGDVSGHHGGDDAWVVKLGGVPACVALTTPVHSSTGIPVTTSLHWQQAPGCTDGYRISLGLTPGGSDLLNSVTVTDTFYQPAQPLPAGDTVYVRIVPFSQTGNATGCEEYWFVTESSCLVVNTTADSGPGSLREAINCANANPGPDTIRFNIPGPGPHVITPASALPAIWRSGTVIDGTTQPGWKMGDIVIDGSLTTNSNGLVIQQANCAIYGLYLHSFYRNIYIFGVNAVNNRIGSIGKGNIINRSTFGIFIISTWDGGPTFIQGNIIGTDTTLTNDLGGVWDAINAQNSSNVIITDNTIAFYKRTGVVPNGSTANVVVSKNSFFCAGNASQGAISKLFVPIGPAILKADAAEVSGTSEVPNGIVEVFVFDNSLCGNSTCQGRYYLGSAVSDTAGNWVLKAPYVTNLNFGDRITATVTAPGGNTSRFSDCFLITCPVQFASAGPDTMVCAGFPIRLTASGGVTYQWSDGGPAEAEWTFVPATTKMYSVTVTDANGCAAIDSVLVAIGDQGIACGLIAHYPLDGNAQDASGNNRHGAPSKTVGAEDRFGNCGQALGFYQCAGDLVSGADGSHVILPDLIRDTMPAFSITLWVKDDSLCYSHGEAYIFFGNENPGNNPSGKRSVQIAHYGNAGPVDSLYWTVSKSAIVTAPFLPSDRNRFVFYGLVYENGVLKAYKDNQLVGQATGQVSMDSGGSGLARHWWTSSSTRFIGEIDDVRIYNRALSPAEINDLYNLPGSGPNLPAAALSAAKTALCPGESVELRAAPFKIGYTYAWYRDGNLLPNATDTAYVATQPGAYQVRVSDDASCDSLSAPLTLTAATAVTAAITTPNGSVLTCAQPALPLQASGGDTYAWSGNLGANAAATVTAPGSYSVTVTNSTTGCSATATATVSQNTSIPNAAATGGVLTCADPVTILFGNSTTPGATYLWMGPNGFISSSQNPPVNTIGAYTLTVTDPANGCSATATAIAAGDNSLPQAAITAPAGTQLSCNITVLTLQAPVQSGYGYEWSGGLGNAASAAVTQPGAYTVTVTNQANGCTATSSVTVTQSSAQPNVSASGGQLTCAQAFVILNGASTTPGVTFLWNGPNGFSAAQAKPPVNVAGTYTLTVTNPQNGCSATATAVVTQNSALPAITLATPNGTVVTCAQPFVSLQASAPGQVTYAWSGPGSFTFSGPNPPVTAGGTYVVTVTNTSNGCTNTASATVTLNNTPPAAAINLPNGAQLTCAQPTVVLEVLGGDSQSWAGPNGFTFSGPAPAVNTPGIYTVTVTNASNACTAAINVTVTQNKTLPNAVAAGGTITCLQPSVDLVGISATPGAIWSWSGPGGFTSTQQNPTVNMGGTYVLTVTNPLNGCTASATATVQQNQTPPAVALTLPNGNQLTCAQPAVVLQASAPGPMAYAWSGPAGFSFNGPTPAVNAAGIYTVTVTNQVSGCTATVTAAVSENKTPPAAAIAAPGGQSITCVQPLVTLQGSGGGTYAWAGPNGYQFSGPNAAVNVAGTYTLTVTNPANGCTATATTAVSENKTPPLATVSPANAQLTCGQPSAPLQAGGGGSYSWAGPNGFSFLGPNPQVTASGVYTVTVSNPLNGCTATATVTVSANQTPPDVNAAGGQLSCQTGAVILLGGTNTPGATFAWTGPGGFTFNGPTPAVTLPGVYTLTVTNPQNNCTATRQVTVTPAPVLSPQVSGSTQLCPGGARTLTAAPGFSTYLWSTGANTPAITVSQTGAYTVSVTDAAQCTGSTTVIVTLAVPPAPVIAGPNKLCDGSSITLDAGNGYAQYGWSTGQNTQTIAVNVAGTYSVTVTDANGCTGTAATTIGLVAAPNPGAGSNSPLCAGEQLKLFAGSGGGWKYAWLGPAGYNSQQQNPVRNNATAAMSGLYRLTVTDNNNCTGTASVEVEVSSDYLTETDTVVCAGNTLLNGKPVKNDTTIQRLYQSVAGCDSLVILDVTVVGENSIRAAPDYTVLLGDETSITINVTANDTLRANWTLGIAQPPGNGTAQALNRDEIRYTRTQGAGPDVFQYLLCAADYCPDLCDTASVYVRVLDGDSKTNAFAPESEYGENRVFDPLTELNAGADPGNEILPGDLIFVVFNRWGEIVHEASPYEAWDGRQNKRILPQGAYYFRLYLARGDERELLREGAVYLLR